MTRTFGPDDLDGFVAKVDELGGPGAPAAAAWWEGMLYSPATHIPATLDPFSDAYVTAQLRLYTEMSGRELDQEAYEHTDFPIDHCVGACNAYGQSRPAAMVHHYLRLGAVVQKAGLPDGAHVLDMGAGWGLSSEFLATLGCRVTAVDINASFVELVRRRADRLSLPIRPRKGAFESFAQADVSETYDAALFYECLHHAVRPWVALSRVAAVLKPGGVLMLAGEPVNDFWPHWGLRLDPLSVYCIRKFGWFESGWSWAFLKRCIEHVGLIASHEVSAQKDVGWVVLGRRPEPRRSWSPTDLASVADPAGWFAEKDYLVCRGTATLPLMVDGDSAVLRLELMNFRGRDVALRLMQDGVVVFDGKVPSGATTLQFPASRGLRRLGFESELWCPAEEMGTVDMRRIALHLAGISIT